ncbi:MAG: hypothetical protein AABW67_00595 [Nanoarchaeota archaeon]
MMKCENDNWLFYIVLLNSVWISVFVITNGQSRSGIDIVGGIYDIISSIRYNLLFFFVFVGMTSFLSYFYTRNYLHLGLIGLFAFSFLVMSYSFCLECIFNDTVELFQW